MVFSRGQSQEVPWPKIWLATRKDGVGGMVPREQGGLMPGSGFDRAHGGCGVKEAREDVTLLEPDRYRSLTPKQYSIV